MPRFVDLGLSDSPKDDVRPEPSKNHELYILWHGTPEDPEFTELFIRHTEGCFRWREDKSHPQRGYLDLDCLAYWLVDEGCGAREIFDMNSDFGKQILEKCEPGRAYIWEFEHEVGRDKDWESGIEEAWVEPTKFVGEPKLENPDLIKCPICDGECRHEVGTDPSGKTHWLDCSFCHAKGEISIDEAIFGSAEELAGLLGFAVSQSDDENYKKSCEITLTRFRELREMREENRAQRHSQIH